MLDLARYEGIAEGDWPFWAKGYFILDAPVEHLLDDAPAILAELIEARAEIERLGDDLEVERMRLAACGVAAASNTEALAAVNRLSKDDPGGSESYDEVCDAVDEQVSLRAEVGQLRDELKWFEQFYPREGETRSDLFERIGRNFHDATGMLRPGKDCRIHDHALRSEVWQTWVAAHLEAARAILRKMVIL